MSRSFTSIVHLALVASACCILGASLAGCQAKKPQLMNVCSCACRQESAEEVVIANKDFYSDASCASFEGGQCDVTIHTSEGTRTVSGKWEGCTHQGKAWVRTLALPDEVPTLTVNPGDVLPPPPQSQ
jgi:hypothetical protein